MSKKNRFVCYSLQFNIFYKLNFLLNKILNTCVVKYVRSIKGIILITTTLGGMFLCGANDLITIFVVKYFFSLNQRVLLSCQHLPHFQHS